MQAKTQFTLVALFAGLVATPAMADHNSVWGAGWANMPNDIHNTRLEDGLSQTEFRDFVQQGAGSQTVNRYDSTTTTTTSPSQGVMSGSATQSRQSGSRR